MPNIINGNIKTQVMIAYAVDSTGKEIISGDQILPDNIGSIKSEAKICIAVDSDGNTF